MSDSNLHQEKLQETFMAKAEAINEFAFSDEGRAGEEEKLIGEGFYRLGKVYYDKADLNTASDYFIQALEKTTYPRDAFAVLKIYGFLIRIWYNTTLVYMCKTCSHIIIITSFSKCKVCVLS